jgi:hypothetical protein
MLVILFRGEGRFRLLATLFCGVLLPLPLIWLSWTMLSTTLSGPSSAQGPVLIPMLSIMERTGTPTYQRECSTDNDCDPRLRCLLSTVTSYSYCVDSRCMADKHCPDGFSCQTFFTDSNKDLINTCVLVGHRKEGEVCSSFVGELEYGCERGLICRGRCGRPCGSGTPTSCPDGYFCKEDPTGATCQSTCEGRVCPDGQRCVALGGHRSVCAKVHGRDCQSEPCASGQVCTLNDYPQSAHDVWLQCVQRCNTGSSAPCPEGTACINYGCIRTCKPGDPAACGEGYKCKSNPELPSVCSPDVHDSNSTH